MKVGYVGNFIPTHSTENHIAKTLEAMGHEVLTIQENGFLMNTEAIYNGVVDNNCDLFLYTRTWGFQDGHEAGNRLLERLDAAGIPTVSYHLDLYIGISREGTLNNDPFWKTKYVFTPDGDPISERKFKEYGINHFYLRPGVFDQECYYGTPKERFQHDVIFVGSDGSNYHSEWNYRSELVSFLSSTYGDRFKRYGHLAETVRNEDLNDLYASAKVVVGDSLNIQAGKLFTHENYWSDRVYETTGRGGFIIHPWIKGLEEEFITGGADGDSQDIVTYSFGDFDQLKALIDYYLDHYIEREQIRLNGHIRTKFQHTYYHRLRKMFDILSKHEPKINKLLKEKNYAKA